MRNRLKIIVAYAFTTLVGKFVYAALKKAKEKQQ